MKSETVARPADHQVKCVLRVEFYAGDKSGPLIDYRHYTIIIRVPSVWTDQFVEYNAEVSRRQLCGHLLEPPPFGGVCALEEHVVGHEL